MSTNTQMLIAIERDFPANAEKKNAKRKKQNWSRRAPKNPIVRNGA